MCPSRPERETEMERERKRASVNWSSNQTVGIARASATTAIAARLMGFGHSETGRPAAAPAEGREGIQKPSRVAPMRR